MAKKTLVAPTLIESLKAAITGSGLPHNELAERCGVSRQQISRFMQGTRTLTLPNAEKLATYLRLRLIQEPDGGPSPS